MIISPQRLTIYLYSAHRAVIFAIAQLSCRDYDCPYTHCANFKRCIYPISGKKCKKFLFLQVKVLTLKGGFAPDPMTGALPRTSLGGKWCLYKTQAGKGFIVEIITITLVLC